MKKENKNDASNWYKVDNAGKVFAVLHKPYCDCVFRIAVNMKEQINPEVLQIAVNDVKPRFPTFYVKKRSGIFWYYFEPNKKTLIVKPENPVMGQYINPRENNGYLFTVAYYKNRIALECCHALSDGFGGLELLKAITYRYLELLGKNVQTENLIRTFDQPVGLEELEDSFSKNYKKTTEKPPAYPNAYHIKGKKIAKPLAPAVIYGKMQTSQLISVAKKYGLSLTGYLSALFAWSVINTHKQDMKNRPVSVCVPINLRAMFNSMSMRNFSLVFYSIIYNKPNLTFEQILAETKNCFEKGQSKELQQMCINANVGKEKNWFVRMSPLFLKNYFIVLGHSFLGDRILTRSLSNLGRVVVPVSMQEHIIDFECSNTNGIAIISCADKLTISMSREIEGSEVEQFFFSTLQKEGVNIEIQSNLRELYFTKEKNNVSL